MLTAAAPSPLPSPARRPTQTDARRGGLAASAAANRGSQRGGQPADPSASAAIRLQCVGPGAMGRCRHRRRGNLVPRAGRQPVQQRYGYCATGTPAARRPFGAARPTRRRPWRSDPDRQRLRRSHRCSIGRTAEQQPLRQCEPNAAAVRSNTVNSLSSRCYGHVNSPPGE